MASGYYRKLTSSGRLNSPEGSRASLNNFDIIVLVEPDNWNPGTLSYAVVSQWGSSNPNRNFWIGFVAGSNSFVPRMGLSTTTNLFDANTSFHTATAPTWFRFTRTGASPGNGALAFYYSNDSPDTDPDSVTWIADGTVADDLLTNALSDTTQDWAIGQTSADANNLDGKFFYVRVKDDIGGNLVEEINFRSGDWTDAGAGHVNGSYTWTAQGTRGTDWRYYGVPTKANAVAYWLASSYVSGTVWSDEGSNGFHFDITGAPPHTSGSPGVAYFDLNGTDEYFEQQAHRDEFHIVATEDLTMAVWAEWASLPGAEHALFAKKGGTGTGAGFGLYMPATNVVSVIGSDGVSNADDGSGVTPTLNQRIQVVGNWLAGTELEAFADGVTSGPTAHGKASASTHLNPARIGRWTGSGTGYAAVKIFAAAVWPFAVVPGALGASLDTEMFGSPATGRPRRPMLVTDTVTPRRMIAALESNRL